MTKIVTGVKKSYLLEHEKGQTNKKEKRQTDCRGLNICPNKNSGYFNSCNLRCCLPQKLLQHPPPLHNLCTPLRQKCKKKSFFADKFQFQQLSV